MSTFVEEETAFRNWIDNGREEIFMPDGAV